MSEQKNEGKKWISFRVKPNEYLQIYQRFQKTTCRKLSEYARKVLLNKPVTVKYRNSSADAFLEEAIRLRKELHAIGNNFNQAVHKLHTLDKIPEIKSWILINEPMKKAFMDKTEEIGNVMNKIYEAWSQK